MTFWPTSWSAILLPDAPILELVVRGTAIYFFLLLLLRIAGRRMLARLAMSDILVVLILAVAVRNGVTGPHTSVGDAMVSGVVILGWDLVIDRLSYHIEPLRGLFRHHPTRIIEDGELVQGNARHLLLTREEVAAQLRKKGVASLDEVSAAYLETDGSISVLREGR